MFSNPWDSFKRFFYRNKIGFKFFENGKWFLGGPLRSLDLLELRTGDLVRIVGNNFTVKNRVIHLDWAANIESVEIHVE